MVTMIECTEIDGVGYELYKMADERYGFRGIDVDSGFVIGGITIYPSLAHAKARYDTETRHNVSNHFYFT